MSPPAYHMRPNKAADRFALIEAINRLGRLHENGLKDYTYFGLGGPYLEDFRALYEFCDQIKLVSFEVNQEVYNRQQFHRTSRNLLLKHEDMSDFINRYNPGDAKSIFWLDYTNLRFENILDFMALLGIIPEYSMIKISLRAEPQDFWDLRGRTCRNEGKIVDFQDKFQEILPEMTSTPSNLAGPFALLLQEMLQIATQKIFPPSATNTVFVPVSSFYYSDRSGMFTLTGVVCDKSNKNRLVKAFNDWELANLDWGQPTRISLPVLSTQERLHLQRLLPTKKSVGFRLRRRLGYLIEDNANKTEKALEQYAAFHRYSPYFIRGMP